MAVTAVEKKNKRAKKTYLGMSIFGFAIFFCIGKNLVVSRVPKRRKKNFKKFRKKPDFGMGVSDVSLAWVLLESNHGLFPGSNPQTPLTTPTVGAPCVGAVETLITSPRARTCCVRNLHRKETINAINPWSEMRKHIVSSRSL